MSKQFGSDDSGRFNDGPDVGSSNIGADLYNVVDPDPSGGLKRTVKQAAKPLGRVVSPHDPRLFTTYDRVAALSKPLVKWDATRDDRMDPISAGRKMASLVKMVGLTGADPGVLEAFHSAMFYSHSVNGGSVLQPGRAVIIVRDTVFEYSELVNYLGQDLRRFFRAYADHIRATNRRVLDNDDPDDREAVERREMILSVAAARGLSRYPELCHDSADACSQLTDGERSALVASKNMIFAAGENMVDRNRFRATGMGETGAGSMFIKPTVQAQALGAH